MKILFHFQIVILTLTFTLFEVNGQNLKYDVNSIKPIGKLVDIGGYRLHINCTGKGKTTVVLVAGSLGFSFDWILVQEKLSKNTKICSYDRPGLAWSDAGPMPRTLNQDAYELHKLLQAANIKPPYILVGHSIGGIIVRNFAKKYPNDVSGIVLVDATSENSLLGVNGKVERMRLLASKDKTIPPIKTHVDTSTKIPSQEVIQNFLKQAGTPSIYPPFDKLPDSIQKIRIWAQTQPKYYTADADNYWSEEFAEMYSDSLSYKLRDKPLVVLCSIKNEYPKELGQDKRDSIMNDKLQNQKNFLSLSTNSKLITTANSGHEIFLTEPDLVVEAIKQIIFAIETKSRLK